MSKLRILVAEDNEDHLFFIIRALTEASEGELQIDSVTDGAAVLDYIHQRGEYADKLRPHMILLDLKMPKIDGLGVLEELKSDPDLRRIPIAVLSSSDRGEDITASYQRGGNTYIVKPSSFTDLKAWLQSVNDFWTEVAVLPEPPS